MLQDNQKLRLHMMFTITAERFKTNDEIDNDVNDVHWMNILRLSNFFN